MTATYIVQNYMYVVYIYMYSAHVMLCHVVQTLLYMYTCTLSTIHLRPGCACCPEIDEIHFFSMHPPLTAPGYS